MQRAISSTSTRLMLRNKYQFAELARFQNSFLSPTNLNYIETLYEHWLKDKQSVSPSFAAYFELLEKGKDPQEAYAHPGGAANVALGSKEFKEISKQIKMRLMIDTFRSIGHHFAKLDPLNHPQNQDVFGVLPQEALSLKQFGYQEDQMQENIIVKNLRGSEGKDNGPYTIKEFEDWLKSIYCDKVGFEYQHLLDKEERDFIKMELEEKIEQLRRVEPTKDEQLSTLEKLAKDQAFVDFLGYKFSNFRRYGVEGLNAGTTAVWQLVEIAIESGVENIVMGMAHRGRLNALHCVFQKPARQIFNQFLENVADGDEISYSGDVKYHLGCCRKKSFNGKEATLLMLTNPSHLEAVNPLVYGSTRAIQQVKNSKEKVLGVIIHGDAAVAGQGVVWESLGFQDLVDYSPGGIIHIVYNNQIGFTTQGKQGRSSYYCTEVAKAVDAPVIHVNGDSPDILFKCMKLAVAYRQKFKKDIFIDIVGYRRYGHNEQDQPAFTQPLLYEKIKNHPTVFDFYSQQLLKRGVVDEQHLKNIRDQIWRQYEQDYAQVLEEKIIPTPEEVSEFSIIREPSTKWGQSTGVPKDVLTRLKKLISTWPEDFQIHPTIKRIYEERIKNFNNDEPLDWATMEKLSWATLLDEGYSVRVSGEDVERGTFSHRHALISDQKRDVEKHVFLKAVSNNVRITNSHLSEFGVLGFEYGYSITNPNSLVIWEAQFGDFANGAAIIIDNFIASGETKWSQQSGIVLSLPHGMDGQGPEHSQGRIQRFLQLSDDNCDQEQIHSWDKQLRNCNLQVVYCSTTSNYFHAMRRQVHRNYRKPLIAFNSKKLLKFKGANQPISTILEGTSFVPVYDDPQTDPAKVKKVVVCSGQIYYELKNKRDETKRDDIAIVRIEQLAPFPHEAFKKAVSAYGPDTQYFFAQEEHQNYGVWNYVYPRLKLAVKKPVGYYGRASSASTAVGASKIHKEEEQILLKSIFEK